MLEQISKALESQDYQTASQLLKQFLTDNPKDHWGNLYLAKLQEVTDKRDKADQIYRQLLRYSTNPKIMSQARQGIKRIEDYDQQQRQDAIAQALAAPGQEELGVLILESIPNEQKQELAQKFAKIMQIDAYTARLQLPTKFWRLYSTGPIGKLQFLVKSLQEAQIPCFCYPIKDLDAVNVYEVCYFQKIKPQVEIVGQNHQGQQGKLTFTWSEVTQIVEGLIPMFYAPLEMNFRDGKLSRPKTKTPDYVHVFDLHLPKRNIILRICDQNYHFKECFVMSLCSSSSDVLDQGTVRHSWNLLINFLKDQLPTAKIWSEFTVFGEHAIDFQEMLKHITSYVNVQREEPTPWDEAFQLYSSLILLRDRDSV